jgi:hypothetical protein
MQYFKDGAGWTDSISVGKIDRNAEKAICFYPSKHPRQKINTVGGKANRSYSLLPVSVLLRWGKAFPAAEEKARAVYDFFDELTQQDFFVIQQYEFPIDIGTDERGCYEFTMELDIYARKEI